jgi:uncharacterized protein YktA (UPF0223 family)
MANRWRKIKAFRPHAGQIAYLISSDSSNGTETLLLTNGDEVTFNSDDTVAHASLVLSEGKIINHWKHELNQVKIEIESRKIAIRTIWESAKYKIERRLYPEKESDHDNQIEKLRQRIQHLSKIEADLEGQIETHGQELLLIEFYDNYKNAYQIKNWEKAIMTKYEQGTQLQLF